MSITKDCMVKTLYGWTKAEYLNTSVKVVNKYDDVKQVIGVNKRLLSSDEYIIKLTVESCPEPIEISNNHILFTVYNNQLIEKSVDKIKEDDYLFVYSRRLNDAINLPDIIITKELFFVVGMYMTAGRVEYISKNIVFSFNEKRDNALYFIKSVFNNLSDSDINLNYYNKTNSSIYEIVIENEFIFNFFNNIFFNNDIRSYMFNSNDEFRNSFIDGFMYGCIDTNIYNNILIKRSFSVKSFALVMDIRDLLLSINIVPEITIIEKNKKYNVSYSVDDVSNKKICLDNNLCGYVLKIKSIESVSDYTDFIYSVIIESDDSDAIYGGYILNGIVSNSDSILKGGVA